MSNLPHRRGSFNYRAINDQIKQILDERAVLDNTQQVAMPFVKVTSTLRLPSILGSENAVGFTLGLHANQRDFAIQDIYADRSGNGLIGYTYVPDESGNVVTRNVYADVSGLSEKATVYLDGDEQLYTDDNQFAFIPPPGITNVTIGTNRAGLTRVIQIDFSVPTLSQLEVLHRTFLVPGAGMVVEWGQQFAPKSRNSFGERGINDNTVYFPWYNHNELIPLLGRLGRKEVGMEEIMKKYVYPSQGQYMWLFGRVGNFTTNAKSDGSFECSVKLFGQGEESWAYLTRSTLVRPANRTSPLCINDVNSVEAYFNKTTPGKNLKTLLQSMVDEESSRALGLGDWFGHVKFFENGNKREGEAAPGEVQEPNVSESYFGEAKDAYFMTWRFFVNVVLNDVRYGIKSVFERAALTDAELEKVSILRPYKNTVGSDTDVNIVDPYENFVGNNRYLRSVDLGTMVIVNRIASGKAYQELERFRDGSEQDLHAPSEDADFFEARGDFYESTKLVDPSPIRDKGFLSTGVWLNHKAIAQSFVSATTVLQGLNNLLNRMNNATLNFWDLTIDVSEPEYIGEEEVAPLAEPATSRTVRPPLLPSNNPAPPQLLRAPTENGQINFFSENVRQEILNPAPPRNSRNTIKNDYIIIDANYKENSDFAVGNFIDKVHTFNKYIRIKSGDDGRTTLIGSDVINCNVTIDMPKRLFSQIATLGLVQQRDLAEAEGVENIEDIPGSPAMPGADELLRQMFAITSIATTGDYEQSPDLTIEPNAIRAARLLDSVCASTNTQTTAETSGVGQSVGNYSAQSISTSKGLFGLFREKSTEEQLEEVTALLETCNRDCRLPAEQQQDTEGTPTPPPSGEYCKHLEEGSTERLVCQEAYNSGITGKVELAQFLAQIAHESNNFNAVSENLNYSEEALLRVFSRYFGPGKENAAEYARQPEKIANYVYSDANRSRAGRLGNTSRGDGWKYRGRGYIQITGKNNYSALSSAIGVDVVSDPDYLLTFQGATDSAIWFWKNRVRTRNPNFGNVTEVRRIINGGTNGLQDTERKFRKYSILFDVGREDYPTYTPTPRAAEYRIDGECVNCELVKIDYENLTKQIENQKETQQIEDRIESVEVREFPYLKTIFKHFEPFGEWMVARITNDSDGNSSNPFGAAPGTLSIKADITLPGVAGLRVGELFWIDRIPAFYRAFGAFQILSIEENVSMEGWTTKIYGVFNYLGGSWKRSMARILREGISQ